MYDPDTIKQAQKRIDMYMREVKKVTDKELKKLYRGRASKWRSILKEMLDHNAKHGK